MATQTFISIGETGEHEMPFSEVNMHMRIAGKRMKFRVVNGGTAERPYPMVEPIREDGSSFCAPITLGEGGCYRDEAGRLFYYPDWSVCR